MKHGSLARGKVSANFSAVTSAAGGFIMRTLGIVLVVLTGCFTSATPTSADKKYPGEGAGDGGTEEQEVFPLQPGKDIKPVAFDGKRAMKYLQAICDIGPRQ